MFFSHLVFDQLNDIELVLKGESLWTSTKVIFLENCICIVEGMSNSLKHSEAYIFRWIFDRFPKLRLASPITGSSQ